MTIGPDIQEALDELGTSVSIQVYNSGEDSFSFSGSENIFYKTNSQATRPFVREFFIEGQINYQSKIKSGTVISIHGTPYLTTSSIPIFFEDEIIKYNCSFYKCNVSGELQTMSGESWDRTTMRKSPTFVQKYTNVYALLTENDLSPEDLPIPPIGDKSTTKSQLFLSANYGIEERDRYVVNSGKSYKVSQVFKNVFKDVDLAILNNDTR